MAVKVSLSVDTPVIVNDVIVVAAKVVVAELEVVTAAVLKGIDVHAELEQIPDEAHDSQCKSQLRSQQTASTQSRLSRQSSESLQDPPTGASSEFW